MLTKYQGISRNTALHGRIQGVVFPLTIVWVKITPTTNDSFHVPIVPFLGSQDILRRLGETFKELVEHIRGGFHVHPSITGKSMRGKSVHQAQHQRFDKIVSLCALLDILSKRDTGYLDVQLLTTVDDFLELFITSEVRPDVGFLT